MPHFKLLLDESKYVGSQDFPGPRAVQIARVAREKAKLREGSKDDGKEFAVLYFKAKGGTGEYPRPMKLGSTLVHLLSWMLEDTDTDKWVGHTITVFTAQCSAWGDTEECLRIQAPRDLHDRMFKWMKKRKAAAQCYMITRRGEGALADLLPPNAYTPRPGQTAAVTQ